MLERVEMQDEDAGLVLAFRDTKAITVEISVSRVGVFLRGGGNFSFHNFSFFAPDRVETIPDTRAIGPLRAVAIAHFMAMRERRPGPGIGEELAIFETHRARKWEAA